MREFFYSFWTFTRSFWTIFFKVLGQVGSVWFKMNIMSSKIFPSLISLNRHLKIFPKKTKKQICPIYFETIFSDTFCCEKLFKYPFSFSSNFHSTSHLGGLSKKRKFFLLRNATKTHNLFKFLEKSVSRLFCNTVFVTISDSKSSLKRILPFT